MDKMNEKTLKVRVIST